MNIGYCISKRPVFLHQEKIICGRKQKLINVKSRIELISKPNRKILTLREMLKNIEVGAKCGS